MQWVKNAVKGLQGTVLSSGHVEPAPTWVPSPF